MTVTLAFRRLVLALSFVLVQNSTHVVCAATYTVTDLGTLGGNESFARAINNSGEVVGTSQIPGGATNEAFVWTASGGMQGLGTLPATNNSDAFAINDADQIVGRSYSNGNIVDQAFIVNGSGMQNLGINPNGYSEARGINNNGQVVGTLGGPSATAFVWSPTDGLSVIASQAGAYGINDNSDVVGAFLLSPSVQLPFLWDANNGLTNLGTLDGSLSPAYATNSTAYAINAAGQIVGVDSTSSGQSHAFLNAGGVMTDLGTLGGVGSTAYAINTAGQIVGTADTSSNQVHAFIDLGGVMTDLNSLLLPGSTWVLEQAYGINDSGQIVGYGYINGSPSAQHAFLLTPVPEPGTLLLIAFGGFLLLVARRCQRQSSSNGVSHA